MEANVKGAGEATTTTDVFDKGAYGSAHFTVKASKGASLPVDVLIFTPTTKGTYPVLLFCHGWKMTNEWYSNIFDHIASHGYIIVAPQFYSSLWGISIPEEIKRAIGVTEWLSTGLLAALQNKDYNNIYPDVENIVASGHSRGGKVAFALALGETGNKIRRKKKTAATRPLPGRAPQMYKELTRWGESPHRIDPTPKFSNTFPDASTCQYPWPWLAPNTATNRKCGPTPRALRMG